MFIICPKCSAKYKIPEGIQLESGQKLKCSACNFVFLKGEEAPFTLEESDLASESSAPMAPTGEAFSEPIHPAAELRTSPADSLPEAFKPIDMTPEKKKKGVGIVFLYLIFVLGLLVLGWMCRDLLTPSIQTTFPSLAMDESKIPAKVRQNALPVRPRKVQPVNQPVVEVKELPQAGKIEKMPLEKVPLKEEPKKEVPKAAPKKNAPKKAAPAPKPIPTKNPVKEVLPVPPEEMAPQSPIKPVQVPTTVVPKTIIAPTVTEPEPVVKEEPIIKSEMIVEPETVAKPEIVLPEPVFETETEQLPTLPEPIIVPDTAVAPETVAIPEPEPEVIPLFEVMDAPIPAGTAAELSVNTISFRVEPTEEGVDQVLIEGQIQNNASDKKSIPVLTILAVDKEGHTLAQKKVHTSDDDLEAGAQMPFYTSLTPAPENIDHIEVKF